MQQHRLILGLHPGQRVAVKLVGEIAAQVGPAHMEHLCHGTSVVRGGVIEHPVQDEGRVVPPVAAGEINPHLKFGVVEVRAPISVGHLVLEQHTSAARDPLIGVGVVELEVELQQEDAAAAGIVGQCNRARCQPVDGAHRLHAGRQPNERAGVRGQHPADLAVATNHGGRHLHEQGVVHEVTDLLAPVERVERVGEWGACHQGVGVPEVDEAPGQADLPRAKHVHIATEEVLVRIGKAAGPIATAEGSGGKGEPGELADGLHHNLDRIGDVVQIDTPYGLRRGQVDEHAHAAEQVALQ